MVKLTGLVIIHASEDRISRHYAAPHGLDLGGLNQFAAQLRRLDLGNIGLCRAAILPRSAVAFASGAAMALLGTPMIDKCFIFLGKATPPSARTMPNP